MGLLNMKRQGTTILPVSTRVTGQVYKEKGCF